ncbi:MAG: glycosyltransferase [Ferruginibacter sp.]
MESASPYQFSIILPVRNGGAYLKDCVKSILSQTITDLNLSILDSGSTDGTIEWLATINDPRVKIYLSDEPLTITQNWDRIKSIPRNEWMTIIGHDDILHADYLEKMTALITQYPGASLYQTHFNLIDAEGKFMRPCKPMPEKATAQELLAKILGNNINMYGTGFMMRTVDYDRVGGIPMFPNLLSADYVLWLKLSSIAYLATAPQFCFSYRINQSTTITTKSQVYIAALKLLIEYLLKGKNNLAPDEDQNDYVKKIFTFYCKRVSRRLITESLEKRDNLTVSVFLKETNLYARQFLENGGSFNPSAITDVWIAKMIDTNSVSRSFFQFLKRIHPNPF